jgi:hypothetical protein
MAAEKELTIAQALRRIKDIKGKVALHAKNAHASVTHKTESPPAYVFSAEWEKATSLTEEMIDLQARVSAANCRTMIDYEGKTRSLSWCTKKLAEIKGAIAWHETLASMVRAQEKTTEKEYAWVPRSGGSAEHTLVSTEWTCHLPEGKRAARVEELQAKFAELNDLVETQNHRVVV